MNVDDVIDDFVDLDFAGMNSFDVIEQSKPYFDECVKLLNNEWNQIQELKKTQLFEDYNIQTLQMQIEEQYTSFMTIVKDCIKKDIALRIMTQTLEAKESAYNEKLQKLEAKLYDYNRYMINSNEPELHIPQELRADVMIEDNPFYQKQMNETIEKQEKQRKKRRKKQTEMSFDRTTDNYSDIELKIWFLYFVSSN